MAFVLLPCDMPNWPHLQCLLLQLRESSTPEEVVTVLVNITQECSDQDLEERDAVTVKSYAGLQKFLENEEIPDFFTKVLPNLVDCAVRLKDSKPSSGFFYFLQQEQSTQVLPRTFCASLLAHILLGTLPRRTSLTHPTLTDPSLFPVLTFLHRRSQRVKLKSILHYFRLINDEALESHVEIRRQVMSSDDFLSLCDWKSLDVPLCPVTVHHDGRIQNHASSCLMACFSSPYVGRPVLSCGNSQQVSVASSFPELLVTSVFAERLEDNEAIQFKGALQVANVSELKTNPSFFPLTNFVACDVVHCFMDADDYRLSEIVQHEDINVLRELNKAFIATRQETLLSSYLLSHGEKVHSMRSELPFSSTAEDRREYGCLPLSSSVTSPIKLLERPISLDDELPVMSKCEIASVNNSDALAKVNTHLINKYFIPLASFDHGSVSNQNTIDSFRSLSHALLSKDDKHSLLEKNDVSTSQCDTMINSCTKVICETIKQNCEIFNNNDLLPVQENGCEMSQCEIISKNYCKDCDTMTLRNKALEAIRILEAEGEDSSSEDRSCDFRECGATNQSGNANVILPEKLKKPPLPTTKLRKPRRPEAGRLSDSQNRSNEMTKSSAAGSELDDIFGASLEESIYFSACESLDEGSYSLRPHRILRTRKSSRTRRSRFVERLKEAIARGVSDTESQGAQDSLRNANGKDTKDSRSLSFAKVTTVNRVGKSVLAESVVSSRDGSCGFVLVDDNELVRSDRRLLSLEYEESDEDERDFRCKSDVYLSSEDNSYSSDYSFELEKPFELIESLLKELDHNVEPRAAAVARFANKLLKRGLSDTYKGVAVELNSCKEENNSNYVPKRASRSFSLTEYRRMLSLCCQSDSQSDFSRPKVILDSAKWAAVSLTGAQRLIYYTCGNSSTAKMDTVCRLLTDRCWTVGDLVCAVLQHCQSVLRQWALKDGMRDKNLLVSRVCGDTCDFSSLFDEIICCESPKYLLTFPKLD